MATIKDIAERAGASPAAVSRVLNNDTTLSLSLAKRQAILKAAAELAYVNLRERRQDKPGRTKVRKHRIALLHGRSAAEEMADPYFMMVRLGVEGRLRELAFEVTHVFRENLQNQASLISRLSGVITIGVYSPREITGLTAISSNIVVTDYLTDRHKLIEVDSVGSDLGQATTVLMGELHGLGYRRIGFIGWPFVEDDFTAEFGEDRCRAYVQWMKDAGLYDPKLCAVAPPDDRAGYNVTLSLLRQQEPPEVLVAVNDSYAIGAYGAIAECGLTIPDDIAVVGFNDIPAAQFLGPALSTVRIPAENIGAAVVDLMRERLEGRDYPKHVSLPTRTIWRDSTRKSARIDG